MKDNIIHPEHYCSNGIEPWDFEESMPSSGKPFVDHLRMNALEYLWRAPNKNGIEDLDKAVNVLKKAISIWDNKE